MAQLTLASLAVRLLSLVTVPVLTHLLPPAAYGNAAIASTLISLISVIGLAGADVSYIRGYHVNAPSGLTVEVITWRFALVTAIAAAVLASFCWHVLSAILLLPSHLKWLVSIGVLLGVIAPMALARARLQERNVSLTVATLCSGLGSTAAAIIVAYFWRRDEVALILSALAGSLIPIISLGIPPFRVLARRPKLNSADGRKILSVGIAVILTAPAYWVMSSSDRWVLAYFRDASSVGVYSVGYNVAIIGMTLNSAILMAWMPEAARLFETQSKDGLLQVGRISGVMITLLACTWLAVTAAGGDIIRLIVSPSFQGAAIVVPFIAGTVFLHGIIHLANTVYVLDKPVHRTIGWWIAGAIASLFLNAVLISEFGALGAAISQLAAFLIVAAGLFLRAGPTLWAHLDGKRLVLVVVIILCAAIVMHPPWSQSPLASLAMKLPGGLAVTGFVISYFLALPVFACTTAFMNSGLRAIFLR